MTVRPAQPEDASQVVKLVSTILAKEFPSDEKAYVTDDLLRFAETYQGPHNTFLVAEEGARIVGTCGVKAENRQTAILRRLFVDPSYRQRGVGTHLLQEALRFCRLNGFREVVIRTSLRMEKAIRLCRSLGFEEDGRWDLEGVSLIRFRLRLT